MKERFIRTGFAGPVTVCSLAISSIAFAADFYKSNNETNLNSSSSWENFDGTAVAAAPPNSTSSTDTCIWDSRVTDAASGGDGVNDVHAADQGIRTLRILDPEVAVRISADVGSAGRTITWTSTGGIDMANATQDLTLVNGFYRASGSGITGNVNVATGRTLLTESGLTWNVRSNGGSVTVNMNTDGLSAGSIIIDGDFTPSNVVIGGGRVEFNRPAGCGRLSTNSTTVNGGTLAISNTSGSATGSGTVTLNAGTLTGDGIISGTVNANSGSTLVPGEGVVGALDFGVLNLAAGSTYIWEGNNEVDADVINVTGANGLSISGGTIKLYNPGTTDPFTGQGIFTLFTFNGVLGGSGVNSLTIDPATKIPGLEYTLSVTADAVTLRIDLPVEPIDWNVDASGNWSVGSNWTGGVAPDGVAVLARITGDTGATLTAPRTVTVDSGGLTVGKLVMDSTQIVTLDGSQTLLMDNDAGFAASLVTSGANHQIDASLDLPVDGLVANVGAATTTTVGGILTGSGGLVKAGEGTMVLTEENDYLGSTSVSGGVLQIGDGGTTGSLPGPAAVAGTLRYNRSDFVSLILDTEISGSGVLDIAGTGEVTIEDPMPFSGVTTISNGTLSLWHDMALQNSTVMLSSSGGSLVLDDAVFVATLGGLGGDGNFPLLTAPGGFPVGLTVGGNNASTSFSGSMTGTGDIFMKQGSGTLTLSGTQAFTNDATVSAGTLEIATGGSFSSANANLGSNSSAKILVSGGTLTASGGCVLSNGSGGLHITGGAVSYAGTIANENNIASGSPFIEVLGGTLEAANINLRRGGLNFGTGEPTSGRTDQGLYINGGAVHVTGTLKVGPDNNSSASSRVDSGSLTVDGALTIGLSTIDRWSVLDLNGGTLTSNDAVAGVVIGGPSAARALLLVRSGSASAERIQFGQSANDGRSILNLTGGALYVGAGGMVVGSTNPALLSELRLGGGTLGASADSSSDVPVTLNGAVVTGESATAVAHSMTFTGPATGGGSLTKNGSGTVRFTSSSNNYTGPTVVNAGTLGMGGQTAGTVTVNAGATLAPQGAFTTASSGTIDGTLAIVYDAGATPPVPGIISTGGSITLGAASTLDISGTGTLTAHAYVIAKASGGVSGSFNTVSGVPADYSLDYNYDDGSGTPVVALVSTVEDAYDVWIASFGLTGADALPTADYENDGIPNLIEFSVDGLNPTLPDGSPGTLVGNTVSFAKRPEAVGVVTFAFDKSSDAGVTVPWAAVMLPDSHVVDDASSISYTFDPALDGDSDFVRLSVTR